MQYLLAIALSILAVNVKLSFDPVLGKDAPFVFLFTAVLISGWFGGFGPAITATICCDLAAIFFFLPAFSPLHIERALYPSLIFLAEGVFMAILLEIRLRNMLSLKARVQQQAVIAQIGQYALASQNMQTLFEKTAELITSTLQVKYCEILELLPGKKSFILRGGKGWQEDLTGQGLVSGEEHSQAGYTLLANEPVIVKNLQKEKRFFSSELLTKHRITSGITVIIPGRRAPFGVLGIFSQKKRAFTQDDMYFLQAVANILATATERKGSETTLRETQNRFKRLFDSNIIGAFIAEFNGKFLEANDALLSLIGYSRDELREGKIHRDNLTAPEYYNLSEKAVRDLRTKGISDVYEKEYINKNGKRIPVLIAVSRVDTKSNLCVGFALDISKQKELERRKDEFISIASHELKTPVTSLKVLTQFLKQKFTATDQHDTRTYLEKMDKQVTKLTDLINDLLDITKIQAGQLKLHNELFNLTDLLRETVEDVQALTATHTIKLRSLVKDAVLADRDRIGQVITNLLTNAIKYSPKGNDIIVSAKTGDDDVHISVEDFGMGITEENQQRIFEQFYRVNEKNDATYPGLGMGLFISREIIKRHHGTISVESQVGKGSMFSFSLPLPEKFYEKANSTSY